MRAQKYLIFTTIALLFSTTHVYAKELPNLATVKQGYVKYHDSGAYLKDQAKVIHQAMDYIDIRLKTLPKNSTKKLAIVLDIDETALSNYPFMLARDFGGTHEQIMQEINLGQDPVIEPTLKLYRYAKQNNIAVFFVTSRTPQELAATTKNLEQVGYKNWDGLYTRPLGDHEKSAAPYKIATREKIESSGYDIILSMGDQKSDLMGGHADKVFKLPNPYYFLP